MQLRYLPATQRVHEVSTAAAWCWPFSQAVHEVCAAVAWYWPLSQAVHAENSALDSGVVLRYLSAMPPVHFKVGGSLI